MKESAAGSSARSKAVLSDEEIARKLAEEHEAELRKKRLEQERRDHEFARQLSQKLMDTSGRIVAQAEAVAVLPGNRRSSVGRAHSEKREAKLIGAEVADPDADAELARRLQEGLPVENPEDAALARALQEEEEERRRAKRAAKALEAQDARAAK
jgi:hypothetical protein